ncbi:hypothetical protein Pmani_037237 [Petrolisthes manimaculis]|uniref:Uncharacterized protein n=1 Tax=Petrolisthes manimaculis TaxID=1843537 RepID=A0AAE1NIL8_9EUCA|nr:hypothetical protein Pmani_037237 [Petrolisthes manimaculis]
MLPVSFPPISSPRPPASIPIPSHLFPQIPSPPNPTGPSRHPIPDPVCSKSASPTSASLFFPRMSGKKQQNG